MHPALSKFRPTPQIQVQCSRCFCWKVLEAEASTNAGEHNRARRGPGDGCRTWWCYLWKALASGCFYSMVLSLWRIQHNPGRIAPTSSGCTKTLWKRKETFVANRRYPRGWLCIDINVLVSSRYVFSGTADKVRKPLAKNPKPHSSYACASEP